MSEVVRAFLKALQSQFHPRMLLLALLPFVLAFLLWGTVLVLNWDVIDKIVREALFGWSWMNWIESHLATGVLAAGFALLKVYLAPLFIFLMFIPLAVLTAIVIVGVIAMPIVLKHLCQRDYQELAERGEHALFASLSNAVLSTLWFVLGWLITLPLWLIPPLWPFIPLFWFTFLTVRILRVDALVEHATAQERAMLLQQHRGRLWLLGFLVTLFCMIPLIWPVAPIFSGLAFGHYLLEALRMHRIQAPSSIGSS